MKTDTQKVSIRGRFPPENTSDRPRYAYLPFGAGKRICVGAGLAQMEATLVLATLAQSVALDLVPGTPVQAPSRLPARTPALSSGKVVGFG
jgi:cytochrome P450